VGRWPFPAGRLRLASRLIGCSSRRTARTFTPLRPLRRHAGLPAALLPPHRSAMAWGLLSWGSFKDRPSVDISNARPLPVTRGPGLPHPELVPSLPFLPVPTVYSARRLAGLLHPATDHGVRLVSSRPPTEAGTDCPHRRIPFEAFPSAVGQKPSLPRASTLRSPTSVPLSSLLGLVPKHLPPPDLRGLTHRGVRCRCAVLPPRVGPMLPWASSTSSSHSSAPGASRAWMRAAEAACSRGASTASDAAAFPRSDLAIGAP